MSDEKANAASHFTATSFHWLDTGQRALAEMLRAIGEARHSICLEMYIVQPGKLSEKFRAALIAARQRDVRVRVLMDAVGSASLPPDFWQGLLIEGGEVRRFNLPGYDRFGLRDHRKLMVCDEHLVFVGGFNIGPEYEGDGVLSGWRDLGLHFQGALAKALVAAFDEMFALADFQHPRFAWLRHAVRQHRIAAEHATVLLSAPGWERNPMTGSLVRDFRQARSIRVICAYFLPVWRVLRALRIAALRGAKVQLILAGKSDVALMRAASRSLYRRLLRAGVEIYEYQPQILHAKMYIVDSKVVYAGSANLDVRSLHLNYELLMRIESHHFAQDAEAIFERDLKHCHRIHLADWVKTRHWWRRGFDRIAAFLLGWVDPYIASFSWRR